MRKKTKNKQKLDNLRYDWKLLLVYQHPEDNLVFLTYFQCAHWDLEAPTNLWFKLLHTKVSGQLSELVTDSDPPATWTDFMDKVKQRFEERLRAKFRNMHWQPRESFSALETCLRHEMKKWLDIAGAQLLKALK